MSKNFWMRGTKWFARIGVLCLLAGFFAARVSADPVSVTYTVSGSSGAWILDFSVTNNLNLGQDVYIFGVLLPATDIVSSPTDWVNPASINPSSDGGPNITYNNAWHLPVAVVGTTDAIAAGGTLSGFEAEVTSLTAPSFVDWVAYSQDVTPGGTAPYTGGGNFNAGLNLPGFASPEENPGFAGVASTPEPSSLLLLAVSLLGVAALRRRIASA
jgi:hypothetical protein